MEEIRAFCFAPLSPELEHALPRWIERRDVSGGEELRAGRVWRVGDAVVKLHGPERFLRRSRAMRAARTAARLRELGTLPSLVRIPAPLVALERGPSTRVEGSLFALEHVSGRSLFEVWNDDASAVEAFADLMAALERSGIVHGDLHPENVRWDGARWTLLDLESVRVRVRGPIAHVDRLRAPRRAERQWARVLRALDFDARVRRLFERSCTSLGRSAASAHAWSRVEGHAREMPPIPAEKLAGIRAVLANGR